MGENFTFRDGDIQSFIDIVDNDRDGKISKAEMVDFRESFSPKKNVEEKMTPYYQVFSQKFGFLPDLSIIDLLFNMGPESLLVLQQSNKPEHR